MALVDPVYVQPPGPQPDGSIQFFSWTLAGANDTGRPYRRPDYADKTVQLVGNFGGGVVLVEGTMDEVTWFTCTDAQGNNLSFSSPGAAVIMENPIALRARSSSPVTNVQVYVTARRPTPMSAG